MRPSRVGLLAVLVFGAAAVLCAPERSPGPGVVLAAPQGHQGHQPQQQQQQQLPGLPTLDQPSDVPDSLHAHIDQDRLRAANDDRHKRLNADAEKLISLSNELKADIDKTSKDELSMDVLRKAAEIEKLAHDVQGRMKN